MFDFIRNHQRFMQLVLLILIVPSFVLIGVTGYTTYTSGDADLVQVGDTAVTRLEYDQARRQQLEQMQRTMGAGFDPQILENPAVREALLESLVNQRVVLNEAQAHRLNVSDTMLRQSIAAMPQLQENGRFSPERYNQVLASVGLSTRDFEQSQRSELALGRVLGPVQESARAPEPIVQRLKLALSEQRQVRVREFPAQEFSEGIQVTDADIKAWYDENSASLQLPEQVSVRYLLLNEEAAMSKLPAVSDADLRAYYDQNKSRYVLPPRVNVSHIQFNVPSESERDAVRQQAQAVLEKARADTSAFGDLAREHSDDAGTASDGGRLGWITRGSWPAELEEAAFALKQGAVSEVVEGPSGFHIFLANEVQPERGETFEQARAKVEAEVRRQLGADRFAEMATQLTNLVYDNPTSLEPAAAALGLELRSASGIARDRLLPAGLLGTENPAANSPDASVLGDERVRRVLFSNPVLREGQNSGVIEISPDTMITLHVQEVTEPQVPALDLVKDRLREQLQAERAVQAARTAGEAVLASLQKGEAPVSTDAAASEGASPASGNAAAEGFGEPVTLSRVSPEGYGESLVNAVFGAPADSLPTYVGVNLPQGYAVVNVLQSTPGQADNPALASLDSQLNQALGVSEEQAFLKMLRDAEGIKRLPEADAVLAGETEPLQ